MRVSVGVKIVFRGMKGPTCGALWVDVSVRRGRIAVWMGHRQAPNQ